MPQSAFSFLLQKLRENRGLSLRELAQLADIDHAYIYRLETGKKESPSEQALSKLIRALKPDKREIDMLYHLAKYSGTDPELVAYAIDQPDIEFELFATAAAMNFRGTPLNPPELIARIRRITEE